MTFGKPVVSLVALCWVLLMLQAGYAANTSEAVFGQSASFSGGTWELGGTYRAGILAAFKEVNNKGGVRNRTLRLASMDDQYNATKTVANLAALLAQESSLLSFIGLTGSDCTDAAVAYALPKNISIVGPYAGTKGHSREVPGWPHQYSRRISRRGCCHSQTPARKQTPPQNFDNLSK